MKRLTFILAIIAFTTSMVSAQFKLAPLPYDYGALEPHIDSTTMRIHHSLHHAAYVNNLNKALEKTPQWYKKDILEVLRTLNQLPQDVQTAVRNNGGGHYNHTFFWSILAPAGTANMSPELEKFFTDKFGSVENFKTTFEKAAGDRFGSGWIWLVKNDDGKLSIISTPNQDNIFLPTSKIKGKPVLALDVWEHAYYLKYQNKRAEYVKAFWNVVNWTEVERLLGK